MTNTVVNTQTIAVTDMINCGGFRSALLGAAG